MTTTKTVLVTDIVGSTELFAATGTWEADRIRTAHYELIRREVAHRRGREVNTTGDGLIAVFDSAHDGVECAVAIQVAQHQRRASTHDGLAVRIGVSSGDVSMDGNNCHGLAVVEACRLCARAEANQVLIAESTRLLARDFGPLEELGEDALKGLPEPTRMWSVPWSVDSRQHVRAVIADDAALMREGISFVLERAGIEVVGQAADADQLLELTETHRPDLAIVDIHMPPTHRTEGLDAAIRIRESYPHTSVLLLSAEVEPRYAQRLLAVAETGVGYLLKERVSDVNEFAEAARRVAAGGTAFEASLVTPRPDHPAEHLAR